MAFPTTTTLTSFTGSDEEPLSESSAWTGTIRVATSSIQPCRRVGNTAGPSTGGSVGTSESVYNTSYGPDMEAYVTLSTFPSTWGFMDVWARIQSEGTSSSKGYLAGYDGTNVYLYKMTAGGTFTQLGSNHAVTLSAGDKIGIEVIGTSIKAYWFTGGSWSTHASVNATDSAISGTGKIGIDMGGAGNVERMDVFSGGTQGGGGPITVVAVPATATASSPSGAIDFVVASPPAIATAVAPAPTIISTGNITVVAPVAAATATAPAPILNPVITVVAPAASATATSIGGTPQISGGGGGPAPKPDHCWGAAFRPSRDLNI